MLDLADMVGFIYYLKKQKNEALIFQRWIAGPQFEMGLDEFKAKLTPHRNRSEQEILEEVYAAYERATQV